MPVTRQAQAVVQWAPCMQPGRQVQALSAVATPKEIAQVGLDTTRLCDYCHESVLTDAQAMRQCTTCERWYHIHYATTVEAGRQAQCSARLQRRIQV